MIKSGDTAIEVLDRRPPIRPGPDREPLTELLTIHTGGELTRSRLNLYRPRQNTQRSRGPVTVRRTAETGGTDQDQNGHGGITSASRTEHSETAPEMIAKRSH